MKRNFQLRLSLIAPIKLKQLIIKPYLILGLIALIYFVLQAHAIADNQTIGQYDQRTYLHLTRQIHDIGGPWVYLQKMYQGTYTERLVHHLYPLLFSPIGLPRIELFVWLKLANLAFGFFCLGMIYLLGRSFFKPEAGLVASFLWAVNPIVWRQFALVSTEPLFIFLTLLASYYGLHVLKSSDQNLAWIGFGIFSGLAYLAKGSGFFILSAFILAAVFVYRHRIIRERNFWLSLVLFILISSPLLVRNWRVYANPFYNYNTASSFTTSWSEFRKMQAVGLEPTFSAYWQEQGPLSLLSETTRGLYKTAALFGQSLSLDQFAQTGYLTTAIFIISLALIFMRDRRQESYYPFLLCLIFYGFFSLYSKIALHARFFLPVMPFLYLTLADGTQRLLHPFQRTIRPVLNYFTVLIFLLTLLFLMCALKGTPSLFAVPTFAPPYFEMMGWLEKSLGPGDRYLKGPDQDFQFEWHSQIKATRYFTPAFNSFAEFDAWAKERRIKYFVITTDLIERNGEIFGDYFRVNNAKIQILAVPADWQERLHLQDRSASIYERVSP